MFAYSYTDSFMKASSDREACSMNIRYSRHREESESFQQISKKPRRENSNTDFGHRSRHDTQTSETDFDRRRHDTHTSDEDFGRRSRHDTLMSDEDLGRRSRHDTHTSDEDFGRRSRHETHTSDEDFYRRSRHGSHTSDEDFDRRSRRGTHTSDQDFDRRSRHDTLTTDRAFDRRSRHDTHIDEEFGRRRRHGTHTSDQDFGRRSRHDTLTTDRAFDRRSRHDTHTNEDFGRQSRHDILTDENFGRRSRHDTLTDEDFNRPSRHDTLTNDFDRRSRHDTHTDEDFGRQSRHDTLTDEDFGRRSRHDTLTDEDFGRRSRHDTHTDEDFDRRRRHDTHTDEDFGRRSRHDTHTDEDFGRRIRHYTRTSNADFIRSRHESQTSNIDFDQRSRHDIHTSDEDFCSQKKHDNQISNTDFGRSRNGGQTSDTDFDRRHDTQASDTHFGRSRHDTQTRNEFGRSRNSSQNSNTDFDQQNKPDKHTSNLEFGRSRDDTQGSDMDFCRGRNGSQTSSFEFGRSRHDTRSSNTDFGKRSRLDTRASDTDFGQSRHESQTENADFGQYDSQNSNTEFNQRSRNDIQNSNTDFENFMHDTQTANTAFVRTRNNTETLNTSLDDTKYDTEISNPNFGNMNYGTQISNSAFGRIKYDTHISNTAFHDRCNVQTSDLAFGDIKSISETSNTAFGRTRNSMQSTNTAFDDSRHNIQTSNLVFGDIRCISQASNTAFDNIKYNTQISEKDIEINRNNICRATTILDNLRPECQNKTMLRLKFSQDVTERRLTKEESLAASLSDKNPTIRNIRKLAYAVQNLPPGRYTPSKKLELAGNSAQVKVDIEMEYYPSPKPELYLCHMMIDGIYVDTGTNTKMRIAKKSACMKTLRAIMMPELKVVEESCQRGVEALGEVKSKMKVEHKQMNSDSSVKAFIHPEMPSLNILKSDAPTSMLILRNKPQSSQKGSLTKEQCLSAAETETNPILKKIRKLAYEAMNLTMNNYVGDKKLITAAGQVPVIVKTILYNRPQSKSVCDLVIEGVKIASCMSSDKKMAILKASVAALELIMMPDLEIVEDKSKMMDVSQNNGASFLKGFRDPDAPCMSQSLEEYIKLHPSRVEFLDNFIILEHRYPKLPAVDILKRSARFNKVSLKYEYFPLGTTSRCLVKIDGKVVEEVDIPAVKPADAKAAAAIQCLRRLRTYCWVLKSKQAIDSRSIMSTEDVHDVQVKSSRIDSDNVGNKLLQKMGWSGGGIGKTGQGIAEPVSLTAVSRRQGLGFGGNAQTNDTRKHVMEIIQKYALSEKEEDLVFSCQFDGEDIAYINDLCFKFDLCTRYCMNKGRKCFCVSRERSAQEVMEYVKSCGGETAKYKLLAPL